MTRHITARDLPAFAADADGLRQGGQTLVDSATRVQEASEAIATQWKAIDQHYQSPHSGSLDAMILPLTVAAGRFQGSARSFKTAIEGFALELEQVLAQQRSLRIDVEDFEGDVRRHRFSAPSEPWDDDWDLVVRNDMLTRRLSAINEMAEDAENKFCRRVESIRNGPEVVTGLAGTPVSSRYGAIPTPDWVSSLTAFGHAINAAAHTTLDKLAAMSPAQLAAWSATNTERMQELTDSADPTMVATWWNAVAGQPGLSAGLIAGVPLLIGGLNGLPPLVRVEANKNLARERHLANAVELAALQAALESGNGNGYIRIAALEQENAYLQRAIDGGKNGVQLYLFDPDRDRLIEMLGDPAVATRRLNWVPGTEASLTGFYNDSLTGLPRQISGLDRNALVFVLKDGSFPQFASVERSPANTQLMRDLGRKVADFEAGMDAAGFDRQHTVSVGHSAGLAIVAASETHGAHVDAVVSLSGAGMDSQWAPDSTTKYYDFTPDVDIIRDVRATASLAGKHSDGVAGFPLVPTDSHGFVEIDPNIGKDTDVKIDPSNPFDYGEQGTLSERVDNHNAVTSDRTSDVVRKGLLAIVSDTEPRGRRR